jgi:hypothetical protein
MLFPIAAQVRQNSDTRSRNYLRRINRACRTIVLGELRKHSPSTEQEGETTGAPQTGVPTNRSWFVGKETGLRLWGVDTPLPSVNRNGALFRYPSHHGVRSAVT